MLLVSILLALHRTEGKRAFWIGSALLGWGELSLSLVPSIEARVTDGGERTDDNRLSGGESDAQSEH
jgi:hypothetical protein